MNATSLDTFALLAPEIVLVLAALVAYLGGAFVGLRFGWLVAAAGIVTAMIVTRGQSPNPRLAPRQYLRGGGHLPAPADGPLAGGRGG